MCLIFMTFVSFLIDISSRLELPHKCGTFIDIIRALKRLIKLAIMAVF
jgi:hypothetical protein